MSNYYDHNEYDGIEREVDAYDRIDYDDEDIYDRCFCNDISESQVEPDTESGEVFYNVIYRNLYITG